MKRTHDELDRYFAKSEERVFSEHELKELRSYHKKEWRLENSVRDDAFLAILENAGLSRIVLNSKKYPPITRFAMSDASQFQIALSLKRGSYISHGSAAYLHGLSTALPAIFANKEQTPKKSFTELVQYSIDQAFLRKPRSSNFRYRPKGSGENLEYVVLNGKHSGNLGVTWLNHPVAGRVPATNLARTLIDITVRPQYCEGPSGILRAFVVARTNGLVGAKDLLEILKGLEHTYPYHQAIGFLMEQVGFPATETEVMKSLGLDFDFYLAHNMVRPRYDRKWRIYYPSNFK